MEEEVELLKKALGEVDVYERAGNTFYTGIIHKTRIVLLQSGIGKVNAAIGTTLLISLFDPLCLINTGSAGAVFKDLEVGDVVISSQVVHHDVDVTAFGYAFGQVPRMPGAFLPHDNLIKLAIKAAAKLKGLNISHGSIATGDSFLNDSGKIDEIRNKFPAVAAAEMEAAAIAQTCHQFRKPFVIIRSISDKADGNASVSFDEFIKTAADNSARLVLGIIKEMRKYVAEKESARMREAMQ